MQVDGPKTHCTAEELAGLPGMPGTARRVRSKADRENWPFRKRPGRGGGREYAVSALPRATREHLADQLIQSLPEKACGLSASPKASADKPAETVDIELLPAVREEAGLPAVIDVPDLGSLKSWQSRRMDARLAFIRLLERGDCTVGLTKTVDALVEKSAAGELPEDLQALVAVANAKSGGKDGKRALSRRTLMRWWSDYKASGGNYAVLAPAAMEKNTLPPWAPAFLMQYQVPQKISVADALSRMARVAAPGAEIPTEGQVRRFLQKYSRLDVQRGRKSGSELRGQRMYRQRDVSEFQPLDIVQIDGHSFKAYVAHPAHGRPFHPEVCAVICCVTKVVVGWSAGLAESSMTVADAIRHACTVDAEKPVGGLPLFVYADKGAGNMAKVNIDEVAGLFPRLGIRFESGRPGNPQGRGLVENLNKSLWIPAAKKLETYTGKDMDSLVQRRVYLKLQKEVRQAKKEERELTSELLIPWPEFLQFAQAEAVDAYNRRPHSALPRITDPATGLRRHMCPLEAWAGWLSRGWNPDLLTEAEIAHLFRPHEMVKCTRGMVRLWKNVYSDPALEHYHGMQVMVGYDIHDPARVSVRDEEGRLIVIARRDANKSAFFPVSKVEQAREERYQNRKRTAEQRMEEIELERRGGPIEIQAAPECIEIEAELALRSDKIIARLEKKRTFANAWERYLDICDREEKGEASEYELKWKADYDIFTSTRRRVGLFKEDEFCLKEEKENRAKGGE
ncbi:Mu transposase C-terminal domain-containing protein [Desulfuromonas sp. TF]|uniref:Mu transposase C-terminal domain-containing protein n=1 Tax=Desulfuromonas sp. TF TaxID=1232410 RepID=UPI00040FD037|nr:Mu transposase C-terminal domain-containing protein [Desulfuromonas sp. TF]